MVYGVGVAERACFFGGCDLEMSRESRRTLPYCRLLPHLHQSILYTVVL